MDGRGRRKGSKEREIGHQTGVLGLPRLPSLKCGCVSRHRWGWKNGMLRKLAHGFARVVRPGL